MLVLKLGDFKHFCSLLVDYCVFVLYSPKATLTQMPVLGMQQNTLFWKSFFPFGLHIFKLEMF